MLGKIKKLLAPSLALGLIAAPAAGYCDNKFGMKDDVNPDTELKFEGLFHLQSAFRKQSGLTSAEKNLSPNKKDFSLYTEASFFVLAAHKLDDVTYGLRIVLTPTTKAKTASSLNGSHIFVESEYGKFEGGSQCDAGSKMRVTGDDVTAGTGDWGRYANFAPAALQYRGLSPSFEDGSNYFYNIMFKTKSGAINDKTEHARKISYFTPEFYGLQFGISYIPDTSNAGGLSYNDPASQSGITRYNVPADPNNAYPALDATIDRNIKDGFSGGVSYKNQMSDDLSIKLAATGEYGKSAKKAVINGAEYKLSNLKTYNVGGTVSYNQFSAGASYGSLCKSLTAKEFNKAGRDTKYYNGAVAYGQGPIKVSLSYFNSNNYGNKLQSYTLGTEYTLLSKFILYAEASRFEGKGRPAYYPEAPKKKLRGTVFLLGAKAKL